MGKVEVRFFNLNLNLNLFLPQWNEANRVKKSPVHVIGKTKSVPIQAIENGCDI
jgi:hypothetical protein